MSELEKSIFISNSRGLSDVERSNLKNGYVSIILRYWRSYSKGIKCEYVENKKEKLCLLAGLE